MHGPNASSMYGFVWAWKNAKPFAMNSPCLPRGSKLPTTLYQKRKHHWPRSDGEQFVASNFSSCDKLTNIENIAQDFGQLCLWLLEKAPPKKKTYYSWLFVSLLRFSNDSVTTRTCWETIWQWIHHLASIHLRNSYAPQGTYISHREKEHHFKCALVGDMLVPKKAIKINSNIILSIWISEVVVDPNWII